MDGPLQLLETVPAWLVFAVTCAAFAALYLGAAGAALALRRVLPGRAVDPRPLASGQVRDEVLRSARSIAIFGLYGVVTVQLLAAGVLRLGWHADAPRVVLDLALLLLWNEVHFYACHRLLHAPWLLRRVHHEHHRSHVATPFATYSFHAVEAVLLGSVMLTALCLHAFHVAAVLVLPVASIALNVIGHSNFDLLAMSRRHQAHHTRVHGNYGFSLPWLDRLLGTELA